MIRVVMICVCAIVVSATGARVGIAGPADVPEPAAAGSQLTEAHGRATLEKLYDQMNQAMADKDVDKYLSFLRADNFTLIDTKGARLSFAELGAQIRKDLPKKRHQSETTRIKDLQITDGRMVVYVEDNERSEFNVEKKGWMPFIGVGTSEDIWEARDGEWKLTQSKQLQSKVTIDPQWIAERRKANERAYEGARASFYSCNYSYNGCR